MTNHGLRSPPTGGDKSIDKKTILDHIAQDFDTLPQPWPANSNLYSNFLNLDTDWSAVDSSFDYQSGVDTPSYSSNRRKRKASMGDERLPHQRFPCPIFEDETRRGVAHTCNGRGGNSMSELRRHMTRGSRGRRAHLSFLKRCETCNDDIVNERDFLDRHGPKCHTSRPVKKGKAADEHYRSFCEKLVPSVPEGLEATPDLSIDQGYVPDHEHTPSTPQHDHSSYFPEAVHMPSPLSKEASTRSPHESTLVPTLDIDLGRKQSYNPWALLDSDSDDTSRSQRAQD
ncbi:hypothetical protein BKA63DRAFT_136347 [Paraphoma chrysanthemicola]|nr:hypothetical protein BKA63DRAFT_136347 [Paraphoma chrysanthemicola]